MLGTRKRRGHARRLRQDRRGRLGPDPGFIERREEIRATYQTFDGRISAYTLLRPYHVLARHGNWYMFAWNTVKERVARAY